MQIREDALSKSLDELKFLFLSINEKPYRAKQLFEALHKKLISDFNKITCFSETLKNKLAKICKIQILAIRKIENSLDGTRKYQLETEDGNLIESVFIPNSAANGKNTLCISSQVGCAMGCTFCATSKLKLKRNLKPSEIINQVYIIDKDLRSINWADNFSESNKNNFNLSQDTRLIHNLVYMGMGEPLHNYENVLKSIKLLSAQEGQNYSGRRITVSTSGVVKNIQRLGIETNVHIAISFNATSNDLRNEIMPINKKWPLEELVEACENFPSNNQRRITFEYVIIDKVNDSNEDACRLAEWLKRIKCKVNLIAFNPHSLSSYKKPTLKRMMEFQDILLQKQISTFIRTTRGDDINAACGMLGSTDEKMANNTVNQIELLK